MAALCERSIGRREFLRTSTLLGLSAAAAYAFVEKVTGQGSSAHAATPKKGGIVRIGHPVPEVASPHALNWFQFSNLTFPVVETLTVTDVDNITRPHLLEKWEPSEDLRTWTFTLRSDVTWRSGRPFVTDDVIWNLNHILDPKTGSSSVGLMGSYLLTEVEKGGETSVELWDANAIEKVDDRVFRLNLKVPNVAIPEHLFHYTNTMLDPEEGGLFQPGSNGTGPFDLVEHRVDVRAVFKARGDYWGEGPYIDAVEYVDLGDDPATSVAALASRQVDGTLWIQFLQSEAVKGIPDMVLYTAKTANTATVSMKCTKKPWSDNRVRHAMRLALDPQRTTMVAVRGFGQPGEHHHVHPMHPDYAALPPLVRDVERAKQLLAEAGYPNGLDAEIYVSVDPQWEAVSVQNMVEQWKEAGIRVKVQVVPSATFWEIWNKAPLVYTDWTHRPLGIQMLPLVYRTGVPWNCAEWSNKEFDDLLVEAETILDGNERRKVMERLERILQEEGPMAQPVWTDLVTAYHKRVQGFRMHPSGVIFPNRLWVVD
jgi:peptide/nickel transport system substrate-binding protein